MGLYGVLAYGVSRRTREFGIRIALGSTNEDLFKLVLHDGTVMLLAGTAIGGLGLSSARPDDRAGTRGIGDARLPVAVRGHSPVPTTRPDDRAGLLGEPQALAATSSQSAGNNFNWGDYGAGMGAGIGLALIALAAALTLRSHRQTSLTQA